MAVDTACALFFHEEKGKKSGFQRVEKNEETILNVPVGQASTAISINSLMARSPRVGSSARFLPFSARCFFVPKGNFHPLKSVRSINNGKIGGILSYKMFKATALH